MTFKLAPIGGKSPCTDGKTPTYLLVVGFQIETTTLLDNSGEQLPSAIPNSCCWRAQSLSLCLHQRPEVGQTDTRWDRKTANRATYFCADTRLAGKPVQCLLLSVVSQTPPLSLQNRRQRVQAAQNPTATEINAPQRTGFQHAKTSAPKC